MHGFSTAEVLAIMEIVFDRYPGLPDGWILNTKWEELKLSYVYSENDGDFEMEAISLVLGMEPLQEDNLLIIETWLEVGNTAVEFSAIKEVG